MKGTFQAALAAAPLDLAEAWAAAVRFAVNALAYSNPAGMDAVLQVIIQQPPQGKCLSALNHKHSKATFIPGVLIVPCSYNPQVKQNPGSSNSPEKQFHILGPKGVHECVGIRVITQVNVSSLSEAPCAF